MKKSVGKEIPEVANVPTKPGKPPGLGAWPAPAKPAAPVEGQVTEFGDLSHHLSPEAREQGFSMRHAPTDESSGSVHFHGPKGQWLGRVAYTGKGTDQPDWQYHVGDQVMKQPHVHTPVVNHLARALREVFRPPPGKFQGLLDEPQGEPQDFDRHLAGAVDSLGKAEGKLPGTSGKSASWQGRPILDAEHAPELETSAALREFRDRVPREKAEEEVHGEYTRNHHLEGAAHHLKGMKVAQASGNKEEALKHSTMYALHMGKLGHSPYAEPPGEVKSKMNKPDGEGPKLYRYKGHGADSFLLGKSEEINAGYVLKKAWPKDEAENLENAKGFLNQPAAQDNYMEAGGKPPKEVYGGRAAYLPDIPDENDKRVGAEPLMPEFMSSRDQMKGSVYGNGPLRGSRSNAVSPYGEGQGEVTPRDVEDATEPNGPSPVPFDPNSYNPSTSVSGTVFDQRHAKQFWSKLVGRSRMKKAWPKDDKDNEDQRSGFPGGGAHQVMEDQHLEHGAKREEFGPGGPQLWEGMNSRGREGRRGIWKGPGDIQGGGKRVTATGPMGLEDTDEAGMNRHALVAATRNHPGYEHRDSADKVRDPLDPHEPNLVMGSGLPFGGQVQNEWQRAPVLDPMSVTYDTARGDQQVEWNRDDMEHGHPAPPSVAKPMAAASKRAEKILAPPPAPKAAGVPAPDANAWAALRDRLTKKLKKGDEGTGVVAAPKHAITNTFISPTKISGGVTHLTPPPPATGAIPKITPTKPQPGGLVPPPGGAPMVPSTPHPMDLGPGMAGHPRQISAPSIPPVVPLKRSEQTIGQLLRKGWPRSEKENQSNRQAFLNEEPAQDALMEQGFSNKQQHGTSPTLGAPPAAPTEGRGPGHWPANQGGWKEGAISRIYEANDANFLAYRRENNEAQQLALDGSKRWDNHPGTALPRSPPPHGSRGIFETPRGATPEEDKLLVDSEQGDRDPLGRRRSVERQIENRNDVESGFWKLLGARASLAAEKQRVSNNRATVKVGKIPADIAANMAKAWPQKIAPKKPR